MNSYTVKLTEKGRKMFGVFVHVSPSDINLKELPNHSLDLNEVKFRSAYKAIKSLEEAGVVEVVFTKDANVTIQAKDVKQIEEMPDMIKLGVAPETEEASNSVKVAEEKQIFQNKKTKKQAAQPEAPVAAETPAAE